MCAPREPREPRSVQGIPRMVRVRGAWPAHVRSIVFITVVHELQSKIGRRALYVWRRPVVPRGTLIGARRCTGPGRISR